jgi:hypothetical protein
MYRLSLFLIISTLSCIAHADDVQWSKGYTANCDNAVERENGEPLALSEIDRVEYYLDKTDGNITNPVLTILMNGGCKPMFVDTRQLSVGDYFAYGRTWDTDGLDSVVSTPGVPKHIQKSRPKSGSNYR